MFDTHSLGGAECNPLCPFKKDNLLRELINNINNINNLKILSDTKVQPVA